MSIIPGHMGDSPSCHSIFCKEIKSSLFFSSLKITPWILYNAYINQTQTRGEVKELTLTDHLSDAI